MSASVIAPRGINLEGKKAFVTGASRGIGKAIALAYAAAGADVALIARNRETLDAVAAEIEALGRQAVVLVCDVTDAGQIAESVTAAIDRLGSLDVVVNNAGGNTFMSPLVDLRFSGWTRTQALNLDSTVHVLQAVGPHLLQRGSGSVINVASVAGLAAMPNMAHYGAAKAAVLSVTRTAAVEWARAGVRVNALVPGWVETDLTQFARGSQDVEQELISRVPMQRWATVDEMAGPAVFLASDAASFMTGQALVVDGGLSVT